MRTNLEETRQWNGLKLCKNMRTNNCCRVIPCPAKTLCGHPLRFCSKWPKLIRLVLLLNVPSRSFEKNISSFDQKTFFCSNLLLLAQKWYFRCKNLYFLTDLLAYCLVLFVKDKKKHDRTIKTTLFDFRWFLFKNPYLRCR